MEAYRARKELLEELCKELEKARAQRINELGQLLRAKLTQAVDALGDPAVQLDVELAGLAYYAKRAKPSPSKEHPA